MTTAKLIMVGDDSNGYHYSIDNGATWITLSNNPYGYTTCNQIFIADDAQHIIAGTFNGTESSVYASWTANQGASAWSHYAPVYASGNMVVGAPDDFSTLYAGYENVMSYSTDGGSTWTNQSAPSGDVSSMGVSSDGSVIAISSIYSSSDGNGSIIVSTDSGSTYNTVKPSSSSYFSCVAVSGDGSTIYTVGSNEAHSEYVYKTINGGTSWTKMGLVQAEWVSVACSNDGNVVIANSYDEGVYYSTDGGTSWTKVQGGSSMDYSNSSAVSKDGTILIYSTYNSVRLSSDTGATWTTILSSINPIGLAMSAPIEKTTSNAAFFMNFV